MGNKIIYLNNGQVSQIGFKRQRKVETKKDDEATKIISEERKNILRSDKLEFVSQREEREIKKTISFPYEIDLIKIQFFKKFNRSLHKDFLEKYGISPVEYTDFNKTVLFQIEEPKLFNNFLSHLDLFVNSSVGTSYQYKDFNLLALIYNFSFYQSSDRVFTHEDSGIIISLISTHLNNVYESQKTILIQELSRLSISFTYAENLPNIFEIYNVSQDQLRYIVDNFDIVKSITSSRTEKIRPSIAGPIREYGFSVVTENNIPIVGVIDTGVAQIEPFENLLTTYNYNHTTLPPFWDEEGHGTLVAGLVILGDEFYKEDKDVYSAKAKILNIKAIHQSNDDINIPRLINDLRDARKRYGVKIFNMSLVIPNAKKYNSSYSRFAFELDKLAYEEDLLIFISVGNFDSDNLTSLKNEFYHNSHEYPEFFYSPSSESDSHACEDTNICVPSESLNNISVGAIAHNLEKGDNTDVTPSSLYPAHYTRKFHIDYNRKVNGTDIKNDRNKNLNKPDFIMEGGDLFNYNAGMQILRSPLFDTEKFYGRTSGTSLSTPLLTSYAAEILKNYPNIRTQSIKAILMNSAEYYGVKDLPDFANSEHLLKSLIGFGRPVKSKLLETDNNSVMYLIEKEIKINEIIKYPIFLPNYMLSNGNKLQFDVSLAYSFSPIEDNHLNYLPLHISFCIVKNLDIKEVADTKSIYGIKGNFSWGEDHFAIDNKIFSNAQKKTYKMQPKDILNADGSIGLAVRCLGKNEYLDVLKEKNHRFSIVVRVTELISNENNSDLNLFNEMMEINNYLEIENNLDIVLETDI